MSWDEDRGTARGVSDSKGNTHYLIFQSLQMSCGPASVAMVESQYKLQCMVDPEARARQLSQRYEGRWTATGGTGAGNLTHILNSEGVRTYACTQVTPNRLWDYFSAYVRDRTPTICHIAWTSGGHFVVCRRIYPDGTIVFLDPWYGLVEVNRRNLPNYNPSGAGGQLSGWLNITYR